MSYGLRSVHPGDAVPSRGATFMGTFNPTAWSAETVTLMSCKESSGNEQQ